MVIVLPGHQFVHELIGSLDNLVDLLDLLLFYLLIAAVYHLLILAIFLYWPSQCIRKRAIGWLFDRGVI